MTTEMTTAQGSEEGTHATYANSASRELFLEERRMDAGALGKLFGSGNTAQTNIAGAVVILVVILLLVPGVVLLFVSSPSVSALEWLKTCGPFLTLILGYIFGKRG